MSGKAVAKGKHSAARSTPHKKFKTVSGADKCTAKPPHSKPKSAPVESPSATLKGKGKERASVPQPSNSKPVRTDQHDSSSDALPSTFKVICGSYEKLLYGLEGSASTSDSDSGYVFKLKPIFIFPAHISCVRAVAASPQGGKWLASGSADEIVKVWDLRRRKEIGGLMHHEGMCYPVNPDIISLKL